MIEFGKSLRIAREAKGLTISQVAELTRMAPTTVTELENEDFSRIAAPIYGRGFVKLYCEAVGLEAKPFLDEFTAIYNGEREGPIRERAMPTEAPAMAEPTETPPPPLDETENILFEKQEKDTGFAKYATPFNDTKYSKLPTSYWRIGILAIALLIALWLIFIGLKSLYHATENSPVQTMDSESVSQVETPITPETTSLPIGDKRTPQQIKPLYID